VSALLLPLPLSELLQPAAASSTAATRTVAVRFIIGLSTRGF
jgi:hypothetical protein